MESLDSLTDGFCAQGIDNSDEILTDKIAGFVDDVSLAVYNTTTSVCSH